MRIKRYIAGLVLVVMLATPAFALFPFLILAGEAVPIITTAGPVLSSSFIYASVVLHTVVAGTLYYFANKTKPVNTKFDQNQLGKNAQVTWIDMGMSPPVTKQSTVTATMSGADVSNIVKANPVLYPKLHQAMFSDVAEPSANSIVVGGIQYNIGLYTTRTLDSLDGTYPACYPTGVTSNGNYLVATCSQSVFTSTRGTTTWTTNQTLQYYMKAPTTIINDPAIMSNLNVSGTDTKSEYDDEATSLMGNNMGSTSIKEGELTADTPGGPGVPAVTAPIGGPTIDVAGVTGISPDNKPLPEKLYGAASNPVFGSYSGSSSLTVGNRFKTFFDDMKTTALFSIPGQFASSIPTGGIPSMSFNGGVFGSHTFDFGTFSNVFLTVKSLFMVVCSWVAMRIVTKGGA